MRVFVAVLPAPEVVEELEEFLEPRTGLGGLRWTRPEQWHVTLAFCGSADPWRLEDLVERLGAAASRRTPLRLAVAGGGAFPDVARGKVLWAGLDQPDGPEELERLAVGARHACATAGIEVDGRRFRPHLTLARSGRPVELTPWVRLLETLRTSSWRAGSVALVASHLGEGPGRRPRHEVLAELPLGGDDRPQRPRW